MSKEAKKQLNGANREHNGDNLRFSESPIGSRRESKTSTIQKQQTKEEDKNSCSKSPTSKQNKEAKVEKDNNTNYLQLLLKGPE